MKLTSHRNARSAPDSGTVERGLEPVFQQFSMSFSYPVMFTEQLFAPHNPVLEETIRQHEPQRVHRLLFVVDSGVADGQPDLLSSIESYVAEHSASIRLIAPPITVPGGEACKNDPRLVEMLQAKFVDLGIDRQSFIVAIGGGALLDLAGYAAATVHRGIRLVRVPSTVLAQNDAGIGVKNGVNAFDKKNCLGTFSPPFAVINDFALLESLDVREKRAGYAEAVKVSLIRDADFFCWLENNAMALRRFDRESVHYLIRHCAKLHLEHIATAGDPFELGSARPLDLGHWSAHKLESLSGYQIRHGEAVAIGIALDTRYSVLAGLLSDDAAMRIIDLLENLGFLLWHPALDTRAPDDSLSVLEGIAEFREHLGGELTVPLLNAIGSLINVSQIDKERVDAARRWLKARQRTPGRSEAPAGQ